MLRSLWTEPPRFLHTHFFTHFSSTGIARTSQTDLWDFPDFPGHRRKTLSTPLRPSEPPRRLRRAAPRRDLRRAGRPAALRPGSPVGPERWGWWALWKRCCCVVMAPTGLEGMEIRKLSPWMELYESVEFCHLSSYHGATFI